MCFCFYIMILRLENYTDENSGIMEMNNFYWFLRGSFKMNVKLKEHVEIAQSPFCLRNY